MDKQQVAKEILSKYNLQPNSASYGSVQSTESKTDRATRIRAIAAGTTPEQLKANRTVAEKIADFTGGKEIAQGIGQALKQRSRSKMIEDQQAQQFDLQNRLIDRIREKRELGEDTSRLEAALEDLGQDIGSFGEQAGDVLNPEQLTGRQVVGDALQLGTTIAGAGTLPGQVGKATAAKTFTQGALQGAKTGAVTGTGFGALTGLSQGLQGEGNVGDVLKQTAGGAVAGGITGGLIGAVVGGISGGINKSRLKNEILNAQVADDIKQQPQVNKQVREIATQQGFDDADIDFISSMNKTDKQKAAEMIRLADEASKNKRALRRPIDVAGESLVEKLKFIKSQNSQAGKQLGEVARSLKGRAVDAAPIEQQLARTLDDLGIRQTAEGLNFENSVFKFSKTQQNKLSKILNDIPRGQADAYDVHVFKKAIDDVVDFSKQSDGLSGTAERALKGLRNTADGVLDSTFDAYNQANVDFRATKEVMDYAQDLFGRKLPLESEQRAGQILRSVFSNNTQRPRVMELSAAVDEVANAYGGKFDTNVIDQALFSEIVEDLYGTQATTSLQGQVQRAIETTSGLAEFLRDPLKGSGKLLATGAEKLQGISDENKIKALMALLRN